MDINNKEKQIMSEVTNTIKQGEKKTRSYKLLVEITGIPADMRTDAVLNDVAQRLVTMSYVGATARVTNISRFGSVYKRR